MKSKARLSGRAKTINLYEPSSYIYSGRGVSVPLEMTENGLIFVRASKTAAAFLNRRAVYDRYRICKFSAFI